MAMPGPEFVAPMVAYLCTDAAKDVNGQIFHAEKSHYHTYSYGEVARSIYKYENNGEFTVDELINLIPASLMALTLCVGFVVDDAIVMLENIVRHMEMGKPAMQAALDGSKEIAFTIVAMTASLTVMRVAANGHMALAVMP